MSAETRGVFCPADVFAGCRPLGMDRPTSSVFGDAWMECRRIERFDVQFAVVPLFSDRSSQRHVHNAPAKRYEPLARRLLAAAGSCCSSVSVQVWFGLF